MPGKQFAYSSGQCATTDIRSFVYQLLDVLQRFWRKCLATDEHGKMVQQSVDGVQQNLWDTIRAVLGEGVLVVGADAAEEFLFLDGKRGGLFVGGR